MSRTSTRFKTPKLYEFEGGSWPDHISMNARTIYFCRVTLYCLPNGFMTNHGTLILEHDAHDGHAPQLEHFRWQIDSRAEAKSLDLQMHQLVIQSHTVGRGATEDGVLPLAVLNNFGILCLGVAPKGIQRTTKRQRCSSRCRSVREGKNVFCSILNSQSK